MAIAVRRPDGHRNGRARSGERRLHLRSRMSRLRRSGCCSDIWKPRACGRKRTSKSEVPHPARPCWSATDWNGSGPAIRRSSSAGFGRPYSNVSIRKCVWRAFIHGAALVRNGSSLALSGPSGSGKSTLAAGLLARGFAYLADDIVALSEPDGVIMPWPLPLSIKPGSVDILPIAISGIGPRLPLSH